LHDEMGAALAAADLVISRAGASTLGEYPLFGLPALLVPYPYAWRYQKVNADSLVQQGAAIMLEDDKLSNELVATVRALLEHPRKLAAMRVAMHGLSRQAATEIAHELFALGQEGR
jgi:UDP-N-acetylglucosamine--N-acetylmuramyl-(pentapeptide) pyrophosphoryl-undecaprenol N-acetylglucosamine transferase